MVDRTHAIADVEDRLPVDTNRAERFDQRPSGTHSTLLTAGAKMLGRVPCVELASERGVAR